MNLENTRRTTAYELFFNAITSHSFKDLLTSAYLLLHFPVLVNDDMSNNIYQVPFQEIGDLDWDYLFHNRCSTNRHFHDFFKKYLSKPETRNYPILINDGDRNKEIQLLSAIHEHGRVIGYTAFLIGDHTCTDEELDIIRIFNKAVHTLMLRNELENHSGNTRSMQFLHTILSAAQTDSIELRTLSAQQSILYPGQYAILVCPNENDKTVTEHLCREVMQLSDTCIPTLFDQYIVILVCNLTEHAFHSQILILENFLRENHLQAFVSSLFTELTASSVKSYFKQACLTHICSKTSGDKQLFVHYKDHAPAQLFLELGKEPYISSFYEPKVLAIRDYDRTNETSYFDTLIKYLSHFKNTKATAESLYIHTNTVLYRIGRIQELFDIDFSDESNNLLMLLTCLLLTY